MKITQSTINLITEEICADKDKYYHHQTAKELYPVICSNMDRPREHYGEMTEKVRCTIYSLICGVWKTKQNRKPKQKVHRCRKTDWWFLEVEAGGRG